jgi:hypothetical protein
MAIDEVVGTVLLSRTDWLYTLPHAPHCKGKGEKYHPPDPQHDESPLFRCILIDERHPPAQSHYPIFRENSPPVTPPT